MPKKRKLKPKARRRLIKSFKRSKRKPGEWSPEAVAAGAASIAAAEDELILETLGIKRSSPLPPRHVGAVDDVEEFGPRHPAWSSLDDDDWNGATFANVLNSFGPDTRVLLTPSKSHGNGLIERMVVAVSRFAYVKVQRPR